MSERFTQPPTRSKGICWLSSLQTVVCVAIWGFSVSGHNQQTANLHRLGEAFQQIRTEQGRGVAELAATTGVEPERIHALERGELDLDLDTMLALAEAMDLRPSAFVLRAEAIAKENTRED
jgi:DNA-binding XRE family transcriptional regulator